MRLVLLLCAPLALLVACLSGTAWAQLEMVSPPRFEAADQAFLERADHDRARFAARRYEELYRADPGDWEAAWRVAMGCYFLGVRVVDDKQEQEALYARGRDAALRGVALAPDCAPCHLFAGINMALYAESVGVIKMLFTLRKIRSHLEQSLALAPRFANAAAARTLALIDHKLPRVLGGRRKRAKAYYEQAIELDPGEPLNYLFYAEFLDEAKKDTRAALAVAERGLALAPPSADRVESLSALENLAELVPELRARLAAPPRKSSLGVRRKGRLRSR